MSSDSRFSGMLRILTAIQAKPGMNIARLADVSCDNQAFPSITTMVLSASRTYPAIGASRGEVELTVEVASPPEILPWILSFGGDARIIEPKELARPARARAGEVLSVYKKEN